jgi:protocadherin-16/23
MYKLEHRLAACAPNDPNYDLSNVWYSLATTGGNDAATATFDVDSQSGGLIVAGPLDADLKAEYRIKVLLNDKMYGMGREVIHVRIVVADVNDNPPTFRESQLAAISVPENAPIGSSPIYTLSASDIDTKGSGHNGTVRYSLMDQFPANYFRLDALSGELFLIQELDYEVAERVFLTLSATDSPYEEHGRQTSQAALVVNVEDVNDHAPEFVSAAKKNLHRDKLEVGVPFHRVLAVDADSGPAGEVRYQIVGAGGDAGGMNGLFQLDSSTGLLSMRDLPHPPSKSSAATATTSFRLTIRASDSGSPPRSTNQVVQISLMDGQPDGPPKFSSSVYQAEIGELATPGTAVIAVSAAKPQQQQGRSAPGGLVYSLDKDIAAGLFGIDASSGTIVTAGQLDREKQDEYILTVYVQEGDGPSVSFDTATVLVRVLDENDHAPVFHDSCYPLAVPENTDLSGLHYFIAMDQDEGSNGAVTYSIIEGDPKGRFSIDAHTGQLSAVPLDHEENSAYKLKIRAQDQGSPTRQSNTCDVTIRVLDRNDNDPVFSEKVYKAAVSENIEIGSQVLTVKATDADAGLNAKISYSIQNGTEWIFGIDKDTGVVYTTGRLDRELRDTYSLVIVAVDEGIEDTRLASATVLIQVLDENDSTPKFDAYPFMASIRSNHPVGSEIVRLTAMDTDRGQNADLRFALLNPEVDRSRFTIDPGTGIITAAVTGLGLEDGGMYHLEVLVTDGGTPSLSSTGLVEIRVGDQPAVSLNFQQSEYTASVAEQAATGSDILQVQAVRSDGRKQRVIYSFGQGNEDGAFEINSNNGLVRLRNPQLIDFEVRREFPLTIIGHAAGDENLYAYAGLRIAVIDRNDNEPRFTQKVYFARAWEGNNKGTFVAQVVAVDGDSIEQERLYYQIVDGNHDGAFVIDQQYSGIIKTNIVLDREIRDLYELTVTATDEGSPPLTGYTKVIIKIIDINDNQPQFPPLQPITFSEGKISRFPSVVS